MNNLTVAHKRVLVVDESVDVTELEKLAAEAGWTLAGRFSQGFDESVELQWSVDSGVDVAYIEFHSDGVRMVTVRGQDSSAVDAVAETVRGAVTTRDLESLLTDVAKDPGPEPAALVRGWRELALACTHSHPDQPMDERLPAALETALRHENRQVRLRGLVVADALGGRWPQLVDLVLARQGEETELGYVVEVFAQLRDDQTEDAEDDKGSDGDN